MTTQSLPRITISAPHRSSGKSTVTIGLCAALTSRGLKVQPFKKGPDFIDPMWHEAASGRYSRNLDIFMMGEENVLNSFLRHAPGSDISIIEGNMGLYDGMDMEGSDSTAGLARLLKSPIVLVIDCSGMTRGIAPLVRGFETFEPGTEVVGVILNRVKGARHEKKLRDAIGKYCDARVIGALPHEEGMGIAMRHLGLVPLREDRDLSPAIAAMARAVSENVDLDAFMEMAKAAPPIDIQVQAPVRPAPEAAVRIGVAMDRAFTFYYPDNLEALEEAGAKLVPFSPVSDEKLPDVDALYIGGGFPEVHMAALEKNSSMRASVRVAVESGLPVYAECGGLMYLCRSISWSGNTSEMAGVFPYDVKMSSRPAGHGYVILRPTGVGPLSEMGPVRAHEFHHSSINVPQGADFAFNLDRGKGIDGFHDGLLYKNVLAGYSHIHILGAPLWARKLVIFIKNITEKNLLTNQKA